MPGAPTAGDQVDVRAVIAAWQAAHPQATFDALAAAVDDQLDTLRAQVLGEALARCEADWASPGAARPACATCGAPLQSRGRQARTLTVAGDRTVRVTRRYGWCPTCQVGLFPPR